MKANIFNIQKFSIHDGPGLRTTVFFDGCPLRCKWCSNPESQYNEVQILKNKDKCTNCMTCFNICPNKAIRQDLSIDFAKCIKCLTCVNNCPNRALEAKGEMMSVEEVVDKCLQDNDFYIESNGGVTLSGGECLLQEDFVVELIKQLKEHDINIAVETCGYVKQDSFKRLVSLIDLVQFDFKHYDRDKHLKGTGVYNDLIIENFMYLKNSGTKYLVRIPVIPGFNDSLDDAEGFVSKFKELGIDEVQLLPFHQFGEKKYDMMNKDYYYKGLKSLHQEDLLDYQKVFMESEINCYF